MKYVIKFTKKDRMAFISHLDLQRLMLRVLRIAKIQPSYSQGYNPHPKISIALPLSLGFSSNCEYLEFETAQKIDRSQAMLVMNRVLPDGIRIRAFEEKDALLSGTLAASVCDATYEIVTDCTAIMKDLTEAFMEQQTIQIEKQNKKTGKMDVKDIRPQIKDFKVLRTFNNRIMFICKLGGAGGSTLNPQVLLSAYCNFCKETYNPEKTFITRTDISFN